MNGDDVRVGDDLLLDEIRRREDILHGAADVLNSKASQALAAAAFLAVQPAVVLVNVPRDDHNPFLPILLIGLQCFACIPMICAVLCAHASLAVRDYVAPTADDSWRDKVVSVIDENAVDKDVQKKQRLLWALLISTRERCVLIEDTNSKSLYLLNWARDLLVSVMIFNIASLAVLVTIRLF